MNIWDNTQDFSIYRIEIDELIVMMSIESSDDPSYPHSLVRAYVSAYIITLGASKLTPKGVAAELPPFWCKLTLIFLR